MWASGLPSGILFNGRCLLQLTLANREQIMLNRERTFFHAETLHSIFHTVNRNGPILILHRTHSVNHSLATGQCTVIGSPVFLCTF